MAVKIKTIITGIQSKAFSCTQMIPVYNVSAKQHFRWQHHYFILILFHIISRINMLPKGQHCRARRMKILVVFGTNIILFNFDLRPQCQPHTLWFFLLIVIQLGPGQAKFEYISVLIQIRKHERLDTQKANKVTAISSSLQAGSTDIFNNIKHYI